MEKFLKKVFLLLLASTLVITNVLPINAYAKHKDDDDATEITVSNEEVIKIAKEAYIYGLSLVEMERSKNKMTHPQYKGDTEWAKLGEFYHVRNFADPSTTRLRAPNIDVLYSGAWVNLEDQPVIVYVPDMGDRYYAIQVSDMYSNVEGYIGTRTTGTKEGFYAIVGPEWEGDLGVKVDGIINVDTNYTWLFPRIFTKDQADLEVVHTLQDKLNILPLDKYKKHGRKALKKTYPQKDDGMQLEEEPYGKIEYFEVLNEILDEIGMPESEAELMARFDSIGIGPNSEFEVDSLSPELKEIFTNVAIESEQLITYVLNMPSQTINGWGGSKKVGLFGDDYFLRALCARGGIGGNTAEEAYYPNSYFDVDNGRYNGSNDYTLTFPAGKIPPVNAFWSLTLYDSSNHCLTDNVINKYAIRDVDSELKYNEDGSLTMYIQSEAPVGFEGNWLPSPKGKEFHIIFRAYMPGQEWFTGEYTLPGVKRVK
ncbi:DUF1254 domain-containing protein [Clostridium sp.]|uniref:DUF1254 domain-containing protein n=1 Tax=Clostridium sp. TaxID=1506 RepID=UPI00262FE651|nr:DUF1254 domain-containing protein [Clostridium sp.]